MKRLPDAVAAAAFAGNAGNGAGGLQVADLSFSRPISRPISRSFQGGITLGRDGRRSGRPRGFDGKRPLFPGADGGGKGVLSNSRPKPSSEKADDPDDADEPDASSGGLSLDDLDEDIPGEFVGTMRSLAHWKMADDYERTIMSTNVNCIRRVVRTLTERALDFLKKGWCPYSSEVRNLGPASSAAELELITELRLCEELLAASGFSLSHWEKRTPSGRSESGVYAALAKLRRDDLVKLKRCRELKVLYGRAEVLLVQSVGQGKVSKGVALMAFRGLCRKANIEVKFDATPKTDGRTIWMGPVDFVSPLAPIYVWGHGIHERNHVIHTDFGVIERTPPALRELVNVFEDIRIDAIGMREFGSYRSWREALFRVLTEDGMLSIAHPASSLGERFTSWLLGELTRSVLGIELPAGIRKKSDLQMELDFGEDFVAKLRAFVSGRFPLASTEDALVLAEEVMRFLETERQAAAIAVAKASEERDAELNGDRDGDRLSAVIAFRPDEADWEDRDRPDPDDPYDPATDIDIVGVVCGKEGPDGNGDPAAAARPGQGSQASRSSQEEKAPSLFSKDDPLQLSLFVGEDLRPNALVAVGPGSGAQAAKERMLNLGQLVAGTMPASGLAQAVRLLAGEVGSGVEHAVSPEEAEKDREDLAGQISRLPSGGWASSLALEGCPVMDRETWEKAWKSSSSLGARLADLLRRPVPEPVRTGTDGWDFDDAALDRLAVGDDRVFLELGNPPGLDMAVLILCDVSGSLGYDGCAILKATAARLQQGMDRVTGINAQTAVFPAAPKTYKDAKRWRCADAELLSVPRGDWRSFIEALAAVPAYGATPIAGALSFAYRLLAERHETHKLVLMLTDGHFATGKASRMYDALRDAGIRLAVLNLRTPADPEPVVPLGDVSMTVRNSCEIPMGLRTLLQQLKRMGAFG